MHTVCILQGGLHLISSHAFSRDLVTWKTLPTYVQPFSSVVALSDGSNRTFVSQRFVIPFGPVGISMAEIPPHILHTVTSLGSLSVHSSRQTPLLGLMRKASAGIRRAAEVLLQRAGSAHAPFQRRGERASVRRAHSRREAS